MNSIAENILYIYLIVFVSMLVFDIVAIFYTRLSDKHILKLEKKLENLIKNSSENLSKHKKVLKRKLKKINFFIAFTHVVDDMEDKKREKYLNSIKNVFNNLYDHYRKQEVVRQTYFIHFLSQYPYIFDKSMRPLITYIIECTKEDSVYLRENALNALYKIGDISYIKEAFYQMNYLGIDHHHKLITDGLLKYPKDDDELSKMLLKEMPHYEENYRVACINYFAFKKVDCTKELYDVLRDPDESKEVRIACIRYFASVPYEPVKKVLEEFLKDDKKNWEYSSIAASTLRKYPSKETADSLVQATQSHNWYVRNNAASSLIQMVKKEKYKELLDRIDDKYAKEAILYQLHLKGVTI